jgi:arylsulfatase A-like enzyme
MGTHEVRAKGQARGGPDRREVLLGSGAVGLAAFVPMPPLEQPRKVLLADIDDIGKELLTSAMASGEAPNLASAMARGRTYPRFWASPLCSQFRARVLTGLDAWRKGNQVGRVVKPLDSFAGPTGTWMPDGLPGRKVKLGKWHLCNPPSFPWVVVLAGYDRFAGIAGNITHDGTSYYAWKEWLADGTTVVQVPQSQHHTSRTAQLALAEIALGTELVHVSFQAVHEPLESPPDGEPAGHVYTGTTPSEILADMLFPLDHWLGRLIEAAVSRDYVVLVAADNGTSGDGKGTPLESGSNTPFFVIGRGVVPGVSRRLVQATDLWATVRRLRGDPLGLNKPDSRDFSDDCLGVPALHAPRQFMTLDWYPHLGIPPVPAEWSRMIRDARWKYLDQKFKPGGQLFEPLIGLWDLEGDPNEQVNLLLAPLSAEAQVAYERLLANLPSL